MGFMHRIRSLSPIIITTVMVLFLLLMIKPDNLEETINTIRRGGSNPAVGSVNGDDILRTDFDQRVTELIEQQRAQAKQQGKEDIDIDDAMVRQQVWDQMVQEKILAQEAAKAGVTVSVEEIADLMFENPPEYLKSAFKDSSGTFMRDIYVKLLKNPDSYGDYVRDEAAKPEAIAEWKDRIRKITDGETKQKLVTNMQVVTGSAAVFSPAHVRRQFDIDNGSADFSYVQLDYSRIPDSEVKVSDEEISKYYDENKQYFKQKDTRKVKYVSFPILPSHQDSVEVQRRIMKLNDTLNAPGVDRSAVFESYMNEYNGHSFDSKPTSEIDPAHSAILSNMQVNEVIGPVQLGPATGFIRLDGRNSGADTSVRASHILIGFGSNKDSAKALATKLYAQAKGGEDFSKLASENSIDKQSAMRGGDLDFFGRGRMVPEFEKAAFAASVGSIVGPVESQFGYHIIKVVDKRHETMKYSEILLLPTISTNTKKTLMRDALSLKEQVEKGENIDSVARKMKRYATQSVFFEKSAQMLGSFDVSNFAFANDVGKVSKPLDIRGQGYTIVQVAERREVGIKPLGDVKDEIRSRLMKTKKLDIVKARAEALSQKLAAAGSLDAVKSIDSTLEVRVATNVKDDGNVTGAGHDAVLTASVMMQQVGKVSPAIRGERGYYIVLVQRLQKADDSKWAAEAKSIESRMRQQTRQSAYYTWYNLVKENSTIKDRRSEVYGGGN